MDNADVYNSTILSSVSRVKSNRFVTCHAGFMDWTEKERREIAGIDFAIDPTDYAFFFSIISSNPSSTVMASSTTASRLIAILVGFLALSISATARPCRSFFISSYSVSFSRHSSATTLTTFKEIRSLVSLDVVGNDDNNYDNPSFAAQIFFDGAIPGRPLEEDENETEIELRASQMRAPFGFSPHNFSSFRNRTKDIVSVVLSLLFGVAGGALTAIGLYLIWSVLSDRYYYRDSYDNYGDDDDEIDSPKKTGYVKMPAFEFAIAPTKESV